MQSKAFLFALITSFFWGLAPILGKIGLVKADPTTALTFRSFVISFILLFWAAATGNLKDIYTLAIGRAGIFIAAEGICASLLGHLAYYYAIKYGDASKLVPVTASFPLIAMILAILFLSEKLTLTKVIGAILIISGVIIIKR
jgi:transporter family protein